MNWEEDNTWLDVPNELREAAKELPGVTNGKNKGIRKHAKAVVAKVKKEASEEMYEKLDSKDGGSMVYRVTKQRDRAAKDIQKIRLIKDAEDKVLTTEKEVLQRWKDYFEELMNVENPREMREENGVLAEERDCQMWRKSTLIPIYKNKGDAQDCGNFRGIKLMSHTKKLMRMLKFTLGLT
ncbi:uncharacterized protein LOC125037635 [Penaeus chinensis]|uniref:uncharacterized protein LOC125037635 n=1 Tax=Penaeus chinensis TaxID=139456 RepID=UPI001FB698A5|nr:uncharacterized protein LOC125037635 [Penaeus chinensis]